jgi:hypothetical protein
MLRILSRCLMLVVILFGLLIMPGGQTGRAEPLLVTGVTLLSPSACPSTGCAAGQRLNYKVNFNITKTDPARDPNLQVCTYVPINWSGPQASIATVGSLTNVSYTNGLTSNCVGSAPSIGGVDYTLNGGAVAKIPTNTLPINETLPFSLRLGTSASISGSVIVRVFEKDTSGIWSKTGEASSSTLTVAATTPSVFVANDAAACAASTPCYINSGDDQTDGFGTGLKDAIDAVSPNATLTVLGDYTIKKNAVLIDEQVVLKSKDTARITYLDTTPNCTNPMLSVTAGASLSSLSVDEGVCRTATNTTSNHRNLVLVDNPTSTSSVLIESSSLKGGLDGVHVDSSNTGALTVRFNEITGNSGWAIYLASGNAGVMTAYANNLAGNKSGPQVECTTASKGVLDHNFWGGVSASAGSSDCTVNDAKRLGAAIVDNVGSPGVQARPVTVKADAIQYAFDNNAVGYQRVGGSDFGLVIVNHGVSIPDSIPFAAGILGSPTPCSNFWDVFLTDAAAPVSPATLKLFFKYNLTPECAANVESTQFCGQTTDTIQFPLYWFNQSANDWKTTGAGGQPTVCQTDTNKDIQVTIDNSTTNHPNFSDLARLPFVVAFPGQHIFSSLTASPGDTQVTINWVTLDETNIAAFQLERKTLATDFVPVGDLIPRQGTGTTGATYQYKDSGLVNNTTYYYHLKIKLADGTFSKVPSPIILAIPVPSTATPTLVPSKTLFPTSTFIFKSSTPTWTFTPTPTSPFKSVTPTLPVTATSLTRTLSSATFTLVATQIPATALAQTRAARTESVRLSATATLTLTPTPVPVSQQAEPLTVAMAILAVGTLAGGAFFLLREQRHSS